MKKSNLFRILSITVIALFLMTEIAIAEDATADDWVTSSGYTYVTSGNVGIGTTSPTEKLLIYNDVNNDVGIEIKNNNTNSVANSILRLRTNAGGDPKIIYTGAGNTFSIGSDQSDSGKLKISDSALVGTNTRLTIDNSGNVGIGTTSPSAKLHIKDTTDNTELLILETAYNNPSGQQALTWRDFLNIVGQIDTRYSGGVMSMVFGHLYNYGYQTSDIMSIKGTGKVGIGTTSPNDKLDVYGSSGQTRIRVGGTDATGRTVMAWDEANNQGYINAYDGAYQLLQFNNNTLRIDGSTTNTMTLTSGNVGIGTTSPQSKLAVNGTITTKEVNVTESGWSDFVFEDDYSLPSLDKVESYIKENKHLPDIPSANEVKEKGLSVSEMMAKQMQKIEELTLYVIEQNKKVEAQDKQIEALKEELAELKNMN